MQESKANCTKHPAQKSCDIKLFHYLGSCSPSETGPNKGAFGLMQLVGFVSLHSVWALLMNNYRSDRRELQGALGIRMC